MKRLALAGLLALAACTTNTPPPVATPTPAPTFVPALPAAPLDWRDKPYTPGVWRYADTTASFGPPGTAPLLTIRCDAARRIVVISVLGTVPTLTIRTSYAQRDWPAQAGPDGRSVVSFAPSDPTLDQIAFSRGRFSVSGPGLPEIDIPAWAEPARVIEDCRK